MLLKTGRRLGSRALCVLAILVVLCSALLLMPAKHARADAGDNYPSQWRSPVAQDTVADTWGEWNRECVSWASWALHDRNGFEMPFHDYAKDWSADAEARGYHTNNTPAVGAIAWWAAFAPGTLQWGHVAWVSSVDANGGFTIEQYNAQVDKNGNPTGVYSTATYAKGAAKSPTGFIHFQDITGSSTPTPTPSAGYDLRQFYVSNGAWLSANVSSAANVKIAGNPAVGNGGTWARDTGGHLRQFYVLNGSWVAADISGATNVNVSGDPAVSSGGIWERDTSNHLRQFYVANGSWTSFDASAAAGNVLIAGNPVVTSAGIYARDTGNHLRQFYVSNGSWTSFDVSAATTISMYGDPAISSGGIYVKDLYGHLQRLYVGSNGWTAYDVSNAAGGVYIYSNPVVDPSGNVWADDSTSHLRQFYPGSNGSWVAADISSAAGVNISSTPAIGTGGTWARDTNNHLRQFYVLNGSWVAADISGASGATVSRDPVVDPGGGMWEAS